MMSEDKFTATKHLGEKKKIKFVFIKDGDINVSSTATFQTN